MVDKVALCGKQSLEGRWRGGEGDSVCLHNVAQIQPCKERQQRPGSNFSQSRVIPKQRSHTSFLSCIPLDLSDIL